MAALAARGLRLSYRNAHGSFELRVDGFTLERGQVVAVVGPNGSGKTTLGRLLAGLLRPDAGSVAVFGVDLQALRPRERAASIAHVPQSLAPFFNVSVAEFVAMGADAVGGGAHERFAQVMALLELAEIAERGVLDLSGGEFRRAVVAQSLAQGAPVLVLDEPTASLDVRWDARLRAIVADHARRGGACVVIEHDLANAIRSADRVVVMSRGAVAYDGRSDGEELVAVLERVYGTRLEVTRDRRGEIAAVRAAEPRDG